MIWGVPNVGFLGEVRARAGCVLASNTSYLNIDEIADATNRPQDGGSHGVQGETDRCPVG